MTNFTAQSRVHVALAVRNLAASTDFYSKLLDMPPTKERPGYAKFAAAEPPLNLSLNQAETSGRPAGAAHFGIELKSHDAVGAALARVKGLGLAVREQRDIACCYARQDKFWVTDPDGAEWEFFVVIGEADVYHESEPEAACCAEPAGQGCC